MHAVRWLASPRQGEKALLNDFWYFWSRKSTRKEKLLYVSSRETTGLPYYPNPEFHQQPKEKLISLSAFSFDEAGAKEKAIKKKTPEEYFALCGARQELRVLDCAAF